MNYGKEGQGSILKFSYWKERFIKIKIHNSILKIAIPVIILGLTFISLLVSGVIFPRELYAVKLDSYMVGYVKDTVTANMVMDRLLADAKVKYDMDVIPDQKIQYEKIRVRKQVETPEGILKQNLSSKLTLKVKAAIIYIDNNSIAVLKDTNTANEVLEEVKKSYVEANSNLSAQDMKFVEKVDVKEELVKPEVVKPFDDIYKLIIAGKSELKKHEVEDGENLWSIAKKFNLDFQDLINANAGMDIDRLKIGQVINLNLPDPYITVETKETVNYNVKISYDIKTEYSSKIYKGQTSVKVKGVQGSKQIIAEVVKHNGVEVSRTILDEKTIKEPVTQVIVQGTKNVQVSSGISGKYAILSRATLTSTYGYRWGTQHKGVDLAAPKGTPVYAWDSGKVTFAGWYGDYGYLVIIDHNNGLSTYYGHNSKLLVKAGQRVSKGQTISLVGSTGDSTGPHVHFEVRKNGVPVNPLNYLSK